ncbi:uncharacterized protein BCR38DRAFT_514656 [Pseudomassariella vexata]|uniref:Uncharacterized protein n=1 Tax=Pseudomassariella vexata TaxID=1141098 RepID=A0A1Y2DXE4_9PEZI|nr:uncharacterized protein BCR38DRAFT_514656 [Pseudomassariella vexata]ORY63970.1 hypothetical protein BCR38DRAFT_514656 [Pseudomassariella vexata]
MSEVKDFERRQRFKKYLVEHESRTPQPPQPMASGQPNPNAEDVFQEPDIDSDTRDTKDISPSSEQGETPRLLAIRPKRPPRTDAPGESSSQSAASTPSPGLASSMGGIPQSPFPSWSGDARILPPPFSLGTRVAPDEHTLPSPSPRTRPSTAYDDRVQGPEPPMTPPRRSSMRDPHTRPRTSPSSAAGATGIVRSAVRFVESYVQSARGISTPSRGLRSTSGSPTPTPTLVGRGEGWQGGTSMVGDPRIRVYDDSLPASSQPQTPQHVPEARHQSRLHGAYTAPVARVAPRPGGYHSSTIRGQRGRGQSPPGLETPGFRGLYGGIENGDDSTLFEEASRLHEGHGEDEEGVRPGRSEDNPAHTSSSRH